MAITALDARPSRDYACEHPDHDDELCFTIRSESSERYCIVHFPWHDVAEMAATIAGLEPERSNRDRSIEFKWLLQELGEDSDRDGISVEYVVLSCRHDSDRKQFTASLSQQIETTRPSGMRSVMFGLYSGSRVLAEPIARFSQKRLDEFAANAWTVVVENAADEDIAKQFTPSDRSCGCRGQYHVSGCEVYAAHIRAKNERAR